MYIPNVDTPLGKIIWENERPTLAVMSVSILAFLALLYLTFRTRRYACLRGATLSAAFLPFLATLAASIITLNKRIFHFNHLSGTIDPEQWFQICGRVATSLTIFSIGVSAVCFVVALVLLLRFPPPHLRTDA